MLRLKKMIPVNELKRGYLLYKDEYEEKALEVLRSGWYILGNEVCEFEKEFADALGEDCWAAGVDNGLDAIYLGLLAAGIKSGDEVIVQANGYIATMLGIVRCGAKPVFVEPELNYNISAAEIRKAISENTKAVLVTHLYGLATDMQEIVEICEQYDLMLFEDCAQSHFAKYCQQNTGTFGTAGFFSFYPTKNLGGFGDGGAVVSKDRDLIDKVKVLRNYGSDYRYHNVEIGFNARLDELQAGLLRVKLAHYQELYNNRADYASAYMSGIKNDKIVLPQIPTACTHIWYQFVVRTENREYFRSYMDRNGICTDVAWAVPPYKQPALSYLKYEERMYPVTNRICDQIVSLPMMDYMKDEEIRYIIEVINQY